jgi:transcriptional regulator with XRE-family HTH domain
MSIGKILLTKTGYNQFMEFSEWILKKYLEYRGDATGHDRSITEFANHLGVSQPLLSQWMRKGGKVPNGIRTINILVEAFGYEVYDVLGLPRPSLLEVDAKLLLAASRELSRSMKALGIDEDDPRYDSLAIEVYSKFGLVLQKIELPDGK